MRHDESVVKTRATGVAMLILKCQVKAKQALSKHMIKETVFKYRQDVLFLCAYYHKKKQ